MSMLEDPCVKACKEQQQEDVRNGKPQKTYLLGMMKSTCTNLLLAH
jgi:hypothetical protein